MKRNVSFGLWLVIALLAAVLPALWPTTSPAADTIAERLGSTEPASPPAIRLLAGTVYDDVDGDGVGAGDLGAAGVSLRLYQDNDDDGVVDSGDAFVAATVTNFTGDFSFTVDTAGTGNHYLIAADSRSMRPAAGLNGGATQDDLWAQQTYGDDPATRVLDVDAWYGGLAGGLSDDYNPASTNPQQNRYQHLARIDVSVGDGIDIDFGFSFNVVTNTRAGDDADDAGGEGRTVQGSFRQFLQNANGIAGANAMRFVPAVATNASGGGGQWWRITVREEFPDITDAATEVDGTAYSTGNGVSVRDVNPGQLGTGGDVGVDRLPLPTIERPELEIVDDRNRNIGLDIRGINTTVRHVAIYGFGDRVNRSSDANIRVNATSGTVIEECVIGAGAASFTDPSAGRTGDNVRFGWFTSGIIRNNLIGFSNGNGIGTQFRANGWRIEGNEIAGNATRDERSNGISYERSGGTRVIGNLIRDNGGAGFDARNSRGANAIANNTFWHNGIADDARAETPGILLYGADNLVDRNVIYENYGAGVMVTGNASRNTITRNAIYDNGTVTNVGGDAPSRQIGIDLLDGSDDNRSGDPPYYSLNDPGDTDSGANRLINFPVLEAATGAGVNLNLTGWARPGAVLELFIAAADPSGFGEGQVYLMTLTEGSIDDLDPTTGSYGPGPVNGVAQGQDNTNRFRFFIAIPSGVTAGSLLTATATDGGATSEFSGTVPVVLNAPDITLVKSSLTDSDPINALANPKAIPGAVILYTITAINTGNGATDNDAVAITDAIPPQTALFVGDLGGFGAGPIQYTDGATPGGLTYTFGGLGDPTDDVEFSNDGGIAYSYTPTPDADGFDTAVTHVRVIPGGAFAASDGVNHPNFSVKFKSRLQ